MKFSLHRVLALLSRARKLSGKPPATTIAQGHEPLFWLMKKLQEIQKVWAPYRQFCRPAIRSSVVSGPGKQSPGSKNGPTSYAHLQYFSWPGKYRGYAEFHPDRLNGLYNYWKKVRDPGVFLDPKDVPDRDRRYFDSFVLPDEPVLICRIVVVKGWQPLESRWGVLLDRVRFDGEYKYAYCNFSFQITNVKMLFAQVHDNPGNFRKKAATKFVFSILKFL
jgi:hypothetical protein